VPEGLEGWLQPAPALTRARHSAQRLYCAVTIRALPSAVLGPVESPPWKRQRLFPASTLIRQGLPFRVLAPHRGRSLRRSGDPSPASPSSAMRLQLAPIAQAGSEQVRRRFPGQPNQPYRFQSVQFSLVTRGGGALARAASMAALRRASSARPCSSTREEIFRINVNFCQVPDKTPWGQARPAPKDLNFDAGLSLPTGPRSLDWP
jgi:hypothetical protein